MGAALSQYSRARQGVYLCLINRFYYLEVSQSFEKLTKKFSLRMASLQLSMTGQA